MIKDDLVEKELIIKYKYINILQEGKFRVEMTSRGICVRQSVKVQS